MHDAGVALPPKACAQSYHSDIFPEQISRLQRNSNIEHEFTVILVPRKNLVSRKVFEDAGVLGDISLEEFPLYFLPLEQDLLSLELNDSFGDLFLVRLWPT